LKTVGAGGASSRKKGLAIRNRSRLTFFLTVKGATKKTRKMKGKKRFAWEGKSSEVSNCTSPGRSQREGEEEKGYGGG